MLFKILPFLTLPNYGPDVVEVQNEQCFPREIAITQLVNTYKEKVMFVGLNHSDNVLELYVNTDTKTYTVLMNLPNGVSCVVDYGTEFEIISIEETEDAF